MITQEKLEAWIASKIDTHGDQYIQSAYVQGARSMIPLVLRLLEALYVIKTTTGNDKFLADCALADAEKMVSE